MTAMVSPANTHARGLAGPRSRKSSPGTPNIPLPMMLLIISPVRAHRPIERLSCMTAQNAAEITSDRQCFHEHDYGHIAGALVIPVMQYFLQSAISLAAVSRGFNRR